MIEKPDIAGRRRYIALAQFRVQHLTGLCNVPDHRGKSPLAFIRTICGFLFRMNHRCIDILGHMITATETRLQQLTIDLGQDIPRGPMLADRTQPVAQGTGTGDRLESRQRHQAAVLAQVHDVIEVPGAFMQHQDEGMEERAVPIASMAARGGHPLINDCPGFQAPGRAAGTVSPARAVIFRWLFAVLWGRIFMILVKVGVVDFFTQWMILIPSQNPQSIMPCAK